MDRFLQEEVKPLAAWYFRRGRKIIDDARLKAGWESLQKAYEDDLFRSGRPARREWDTWVERVEFDSFVFRALGSAGELEREGRTMHHCIGQYARVCENDSRRVYAVEVKQSGKRVATLTVKPGRDGAWQLDQIHGPRNDKVPNRLQQAADAVCRSLDERFRRDPALRKKMRSLAAMDQDDLVLWEIEI